MSNGTGPCLVCGHRTLILHHASYAQWIRQHVPADEFRGRFRDERNLVRLCHRHHGQHHNRMDVLPLALLPDSVFEFAAEVFGPGLAYERLRRTYSGDDRRLDSLIDHLEEVCDRPAA